MSRGGSSFSSSGDSRINQVLEERAKRADRAVSSHRPPIYRGGRAVRRLIIPLVVILLLLGVGMAVSLGYLNVSTLAGLAGNTGEDLPEPRAEVEGSQDATSVSPKAGLGEAVRRQADMSSNDEMKAGPIVDRLLALTHQPLNDENVATIKALTRQLLRQIPMPEKKRWELNRVIDLAALPSRDEMAQSSGRRGFRKVSAERMLIVYPGTTSLTSASHSLILADGPVSLTVSENNIIISGDAVRFNSEGEFGGGLIVAKGEVPLFRTHNTLVYVGGGIQAPQ